MSTATLRNGRDTYVVEDRPNDRLHNKPTLWLNNTAANTRYAYIYFTRPFPIGATIISAKLRLYNKGFWPGTTRIRLRRINEQWSVSRTRWSNRPGVWEYIVDSDTFADGANDGTEWVLDVQPEMQRVANGVKWYGFRIETTETAQRSLYSTQGRWKYRPVLEVTWADNPDEPEDLAPSAGRAVSLSHPTLRFDFTDVSGDTDLQSVHVQTAVTDAALDAGTPAWDSGVVAASNPELDLGAGIRTASVTTTSTSTAITSADAEFTAADVGASIVGEGIPAGATITAVTDATNATISAAATASGTVTATITRSGTYPGIAIDEIVWWRVRVQDGAGLWSGWSEPENFTRKAKGIITITNPALEPNNFIEEPTPPVSWTFSKPQRAYQVYIYDYARREWVWDVGKVTATDQNVTIERGVIRGTGSLYRLWVRVWDLENRESTPGDPVYTDAWRDFTYNFDATTDPVTSFIVTEDRTYSMVTLQWERLTAPDTYTVLRDNRVIESDIEPDELLIPGTTTYRYTDRGGSPREEHDWKVVAVVNGRSSANNPTVSATPKAITTCISRPNGADPVLLFNPDNDVQLFEATEIHQITGDAPPVLIRQSLGGYVGSIAGRIADHGNTTARQFLDRLDELRQDTGMKMLLTTADLAIECIIYNITHHPIPIADGTTEYEVSADFYQTDEW